MALDVLFPSFLTGCRSPLSPTWSVLNEGVSQQVQQIATELERSLSVAHGEKQRLQDENMALKVDVQSSKMQCLRLQNKVGLLSDMASAVCLAVEIPPIPASMRD
jgi:hypothetical protein